MRRVASAVIGFACIACGGGSPSPDPGSDASTAPTHAKVQAIVARACTFTASCHGGEGAGQAGLNFAAYDTLMGALAADGGTPRSACGYSPMPIVDPGHPENSWLMVKIAGPVNEDLEIVAGDWGPAEGFVPGENVLCPDFGQRMPQTGAMLSPDEVELFRGWIAAGATGS